jgi:hypothetical protein
VGHVKSGLFSLYSSLLVSCILSYSPPFPLPIPFHTSKYISDKQELFGYLETHDPRHEPRSGGGVSDKPRLSEMERCR